MITRKPFLLASTLLLALSLPVVAAQEGAPDHCAFDASRVITQGQETLFVAEDLQIDHYQRVLVSPIALPEPESPTLDSAEEARMMKTVKRAIELEWKERFGWRSADNSAADVLRMKVFISEIDTEKGFFTLDMSLTDSVSGQLLMSQCNEQLSLPTTHRQQVSWAGVRDSVMDWGAGLGSHIMALN